MVHEGVLSLGRGAECLPACSVVNHTYYVACKRLDAKIVAARKV